MSNINSQQVIIALLIVCGIMLIWSLWKKELIAAAIKAVLGMGIIYGVNLLIPTISIGINWLTIGISSILGIPGVIMLYIINGAM